MKDKAISILEKQGVEEAIRFLKEQEMTVETGSLFNDLMRHAFWKKHDLESTVILAQAGISYNAEHAKSSSKEDEERFLTNVKQISYNLASFTWPGWDEEWIESIPKNYLKLGYEAAKSNLQYAIELEKGDLGLSRGHWIVAAHQLVSGEYLLAKENFIKAVEFAVNAGEKGDELLSKGFIHVASLLETPDNSESTESLNTLKGQLSELEYGDFYIKQLDDSLRIFGS